MTPSPTTTGNPTLDKIRAGQLDDPQVRRAFEIARQNGIMPPIGGQAQGEQPPAPKPIAAPSSRVYLGLGATPEASPASPDAANGSIRPLAAVPAAPRPSANQRELRRLETSPSGIGQIKHAGIRIPLQVADAIGSAFVPSLTAALPGTEFHHRRLLREAGENVNQEQSEATAEAQRQHLNAETAELPARAAHEEAQAHSLLNPKDEWQQANEPETDPAHPELGPQAVWYKKTDPHQKVYGNAPVAAKPVDHPKQAPHYTQIPGVGIVATTVGSKGDLNSQVVFKEDPKIETDLTDLQIGGKPHKVIVNKQTGKVIQDLGESGIKPPVVSVHTENAALDHEIAQYGKPWQTMTSGVSSQLDKILDAEKMVAGGAVQQALGIPKVLTALVSGQGSGVRITQAELNSIAKARGIAGDIEGWFNKLGGKGQLTDTQKQQLNSILSDVRERILQKKAIADEAINSMQAGSKREDILAADKTAREALDKFERGGGQSHGAAQGGYVIGKKYQGKEYLGGNPNDQGSWK